MHSEYLPKWLSAADLLILSLNAKSLVSEEEMDFRTSLQSFKQSWGLSDSKYKYDRYSAADKLFGENYIAFYK